MSQKLAARHLSYPTNSEAGVSLIIVMIVLTVVSVLGIAGIQISSLGEKSARNDRDLQIAWQSAEAAMLDAELDIRSSTVAARAALFGSDTSAFVQDCGQGPNASGLCALVPTTGTKPGWLTVDFTQTGSSARTAEFGQYTGRQFAAGASGIQPARRPRYVIEPIIDTSAGNNARDQSSTEKKISYRVTAMGFGPRPEIQAVVQGIVRP